MSNNYLQSAQDGLVFDIKDPVKSGSILQAIGPKLENNQYWSTQDVPGQPGYFWIVSADSGLVVDIQTPVASGSPLQALVQKNENNQWWTLVPVPGQPGYSWITSAAKDSAGQALVVDIKHPVIAGSALQALVQKNEGNQWWQSVSAQPALTPGGATPGSYANYILGSPTCEILRDVRVTIEITEDLVTEPQDKSLSNYSPNFAFQLNANSSANGAAPPSTWIVWQQYILGVGPIIGCAVNNWTNPSLASGNQTISSSDTTLVTLPTPNTIPAGYVIEFILLYDKAGNVTGATFGVNDGHTNHQVSQVLTSLPGVTSAETAPIVAFELNLVGPGNGQTTRFSSGAGTITYSSSSILTAQSAIPSCAGSNATTGETSNSVYGLLPSIASTTFTQTFSHG